MRYLLPARAAELVKDAGAAMIIGGRILAGTGGGHATGDIEHPELFVRLLCTSPAAVPVRGAPARLAIPVSTLMPRRAAAR